MQFLQLPVDAMLNLEVIRGPLPSNQDYQAILAEFRRLMQSRLSERFMYRWCKESPAGPALHALLRTDEGKIVGHACIFPFPIEVAGKKRTAGKGHYVFVHEDFRREPVRGMNGGRSRASTLMLQELFRHATEQLKWDPILVSPRPTADRALQAAGCRPLMFTPFECLLIRRPWKACFLTPSLSLAKRLALLFVGLPQTCIWAVARLLLLHLGRKIKALPMDASCPPLNDREKAHFSSDPDYLSWRYPAEAFQRFGFANRPNEYVITEKGSPGNYVRICQSHLEDFPVLPLIVALMGQARSSHALGVRWGIYGNGRHPAVVVNKLKRLGFVCAPWPRRFWIYTRHDELADPSCWSFDDSLFTFPE